jgi:hypothetical protein
MALPKRVVAGRQTCVAPPEGWRIRIKPTVFDDIDRDFMGGFRIAPCIDHAVLDKNGLPETTGPEPCLLRRPGAGSAGPKTLLDQRRKGHLQWRGPLNMRRVQYGGAASRDHTAYMGLSPPFTDHGFSLGIPHDDRLLGRVTFAPWIVRLPRGRTLRRHRDRSYRCRSIAPDAVRRSLGRAGAGSATARATTMLQRPAAAELFAPGSHLAAVLPGQFAGQVTSNPIRL